ncbi:MAG: hypothetical protein WC473_06055 [Patescibacteria group bacterium]|jgi:hypothetical protein
MAERINGYDFKMKASSSEANMAAVITALSSADANTVQKEGVSVKIDPHILDVITSESEEPKEKIDIGAKIEIKAVLVGGTLDQLKSLLNNEAAETAAIVESTRCYPLPTWHCQFKVRKTDGATVETWTISWLFMVGSLDAAFKGGEIWYLPISLVSSSQSQLQITSA